MANLTITVAEATLKRARIRSIERGESVNAYLAEALQRYAGSNPQAEVAATVLRIAREAGAGIDADQRSWTRDDLHRV